MLDEVDEVLTLHLQQEVYDEHEVVETDEQQIMPEQLALQIHEVEGGEVEPILEIEEYDEPE